jgi:hypothetical protein
MRKIRGGKLTTLGDRGRIQLIGRGDVRGRMMTNLGEKGGG